MNGLRARNTAKAWKSGSTRTGTKWHHLVASSSKTSPMDLVRPDKNRTKVVTKFSILDGRQGALKMVSVNKLKLMVLSTEVS